ncbi:hypothetical protein GN956_G26297 [Arapaima gigas]
MVHNSIPLTSTWCHVTEETGVTQNTAADGNNNGDDDVGVAMWSAAAGLPVLTATGLLIVLWQKFVPGSKEENIERTQQPLADNRDAGK